MIVAYFFWATLYLPSLSYKCYVAVRWFMHRVILSQSKLLTTVAILSGSRASMARRLWKSALPLASARFSKLCIPFLNHLSDGELCKNVFDFHIFSFFLVFNHDFVIYTVHLIYPCRSFKHSNWWRHKLSHIEQRYAQNFRPRWHAAGVAMTTILCHTSWGAALMYEVWSWQDNPVLS